MEVWHDRPDNTKDLIHNPDFNEIFMRGPGWVLLSQQTPFSTPATSENTTMKATREPRMAGGSLESSRAQEDPGQVSFIVGVTVVGYVEVVRAFRAE